MASFRLHCPGIIVIVLLRLISCLPTSENFHILPRFSPFTDVFTYPPPWQNDSSINLDYAVGDVVSVLWTQSIPDSSPGFICANDQQHIFETKWSISLTELPVNPTSINYNVTIPDVQFNKCYFHINETGTGTPSLGFNTSYIAILPRRGSGPVYHKYVEPRVTTQGTGSGSGSDVVPGVPQVPTSPSSSSNSISNASAPVPGSPIFQFTNTNQVSPNCLDETARNSAECWDQLAIEDWLNVWASQLYPCAANRSSGSCSEPWTSKFQTTMDGWSGRDCSDLTRSTPCHVAEQIFNPAINHTRDMQSYMRYKYVDFAITSLFDYFRDFESQTQQALISVANSIDTIVNIIAPVQKPHFNWAKEIFTTLATIAIGLIPGVGPEAAIAIRIAVAGGLGLLKLGVNAASGALFPPRTPNNPELEIDALKTSLLSTSGDSVLTEISSNVDITLGAAQGKEYPNATAPNDLSIFLNFTRNGLFSNASAPVIPDGSLKILTKLLQTYIISLTLSSNGYHVLMLPGVNPTAVYSNPKASCPQWAGNDCSGQKHADLGCQGNLDKNNMCGYLYYDAETNSSYTLQHTQKTDIDAVKKIMSQLFAGADSGNSLTTGSSLLAGPAICDLQALFPDDVISSTSYSLFQGNYGFIFPRYTFLNPSGCASTGQKDCSVQVNNTHSFVALDGGAPGYINPFVELSKEASYTSGFKHPDTVWRIDPALGLANVNCTSQMNLTVANHWGGAKLDEWFKPGN